MNSNDNPEFEMRGKYSEWESPAQVEKSDEEIFYSHVYRGWGVALVGWLVLVAVCAAAYFWGRP
jgi:hypothetical protein